MLLVSYPFLPGLICLYLCLEPLPCLLQHNLPPIVILLEHLLNLCRYLHPFSLLIRVLLEHREHLTREFLVVNERLLDIRGEAGLVTLVSIR
jgi:hypothetical protein